MTDADVDGAHIATLLMGFFYNEFPKLIDDGQLYLSVPPLFKISKGGKIFYAVSERHKDDIVKKEFKNSENIEINLDDFENLKNIEKTQGFSESILSKNSLN